MTCNKFYIDERERYNYAFYTFLADSDIQHLKTKVFCAFAVPDIEVVSGSKLKNFYFFDGHISLEEPCEMGSLAHELAHHIQYVRTGQTKHYKPLLLLIGEVLNVCLPETI